MSDSPLIIAKKKFTSRLILGTGKFSSPTVMKSAIEASQAEIITTAVRRVNFKDPQDPFTTIIDPKRFLFLPNTSGARDAEEAIRIAKLAKASGITNWIKLEVTPEPNHLLPDPIETLKAAEYLVKHDFVVLPYINADPVLAKHLEDAGCATVMPLAAPIGSNRGIQNREMILKIIQQARVPVIIDAGLGAPSHAALAMEMGADAVMINTAIATAYNPIAMAEAFRMAVEAGREGFRAGLPKPHGSAIATSPLTGFLRKVITE